MIKYDLVEKIIKHPNLKFNIDKALINGDFENHSHTFSEIVFVLSGCGKHQYNGCEYEISKGDVFVLKGCEEHGFSSCDNLCIFNIMFDPNYFLDFEDCKFLPGFWAMFVNERYSVNISYHKLVGETYSLMLSYCETMLKELTESEDGFVTMCKALLMQIIIFLSRSYQNSSENRNLIDFKFAKIIVFIEEHFRDDITIDELSHYAYLSKRHFARLFKEIYHKTPLNYILDLRIEYAKKLLQTNQLSMTIIAEKCGFKDSNYFSRIFKSKTGLSPKNWIK